MTAGSKRMVILHATQGHAGMSPRQNFGRGWGKPKRVPIKSKTTLPHFPSSMPGTCSSFTFYF